MSEVNIDEIIDRAIERHTALNPVPPTVTTQQAAKMLKVSERTIQRLGPPRVGKMIPYDWVKRQCRGTPSTRP